MVARLDRTADPAIIDALLTVRRGTAFYQRALAGLNDDELWEPSLLPGWSRRHVIAHVAYNARAITRLVQWANTGVETPMYTTLERRNAEIELGATLPAHALRHLDDHAAISLDVEWRDSPPAVWTKEVRTAQGRVVPLSETIWMRTREVWLHAIDLHSTARLPTIPESVLRRLLDDVLSHWERTGQGEDLRVEVHGSEGQSWGGGTSLVVGSLAAVVGWATGRATGSLDTGADIPAPRWI